MTPLRLGLIGGGWIAAPHIRAIQDLSERCVLVWVTDPNREKSDEIAARAHCRALTAYEDGLKDVDAVIIATPHHLHAPMAIAAAQAGKHILLEKPLATTLADADHILRAVSQAGVTLLVGYTRHYQPEFRRLRTLVESGRCGRILILSATMIEHVGNYVTGWLARREQLGGGCFFSAGGHPLEWMVSVAGPVIDMNCMMERFVIAMDGEDTAVASLRFANGALGTLVQSWCQPNSTEWMTVRVEGTDGILTLDLSPLRDGPALWTWDARLAILERHEEQVIYSGPAGFEFTPQLNHFLDCVDGRAEPETGGTYARDLMQTILKGYGAGANNWRTGEN